MSALLPLLPLIPIENVWNRPTGERKWPINSGRNIVESRSIIRNARAIRIPAIIFDFVISFRLIRENYKIIGFRVVNVRCASAPFRCCNGAIVKSFWFWWPLILSMSVMSTGHLWQCHHHRRRWDKTVEYLSSKQMCEWNSAQMR